MVGGLAVLLNQNPCNPTGLINKILLKNKMVIHVNKSINTIRKGKGKSGITRVVYRLINGGALIGLNVYLYTYKGAILRAKNEAK